MPTPWQTGQLGCAKTYRYVKNIFTELDGANGTLREFGSVVTVPLDRWPGAQEANAAGEHSSLEVHGVSAQAQQYGDHPKKWVNPHRNSQKLEVKVALGGRWLAV